MKAIKYLLISAVTIAAGIFGKQPDRKVELLVCGDSKVLIVDYNNSRDTIPAIVWEWDATKATDLPEIYRTTYFRSVDDSKSVMGGKNILISSSSGGIVLVGQADKKVKFYARVPNAHSIEMLPNNRIVVAGSTAQGGNRVALYDISKPDQQLFRDSLYSGHGVVWHQQRKKLYALGYDQLRQYALSDWNSNAPKLKLEKHWKIPGISGHDLQLSPDGKELFFTETNSPWIFDLSSGQFRKFPELADTAHLKSIGRHPKTGQLVYTLPEESWWTFHVKFLKPERSLAFPGMRVYKARWVVN